MLATDSLQLSSSLGISLPGRELPHPEQWSLLESRLYPMTGPCWGTKAWPFCLNWKKTAPKVHICSRVPQRISQGLYRNFCKCITIYLFPLPMHLPSQYHRYCSRETSPVTGLHTNIILRICFWGKLTSDIRTSLEVTTIIVLMSMSIIFRQYEYSVMKVIGIYSLINNVLWSSVP